MIVKIVRMVSLAGFEPTTLRLGIIRSIQLSYKDILLSKQETLLISPLLSGSNLLAFFNFLFKDFAGFEFRYSFVFGFISFIASWNFTLFAFLLCGFKFAKTNQLHAFTLA